MRALPPTWILTHSFRSPPPPCLDRYPSAVVELARRLGAKWKETSGAERERRGKACLFLLYLIRFAGLPKFVRGSALGMRTVISQTPYQHSFSSKPESVDTKFCFELQTCIFQNVFFQPLPIFSTANFSHNCLLISVPISISARAPRECAERCRRPPVGHLCRTGGQPGGGR